MSFWFLPNHFNTRYKGILGWGVVASSFWSRKWMSGWSDQLNLYLTILEPLPSPFSSRVCRRRQVFVHMNICWKELHIPVVWVCLQPFCNFWLIDQKKLRKCRPAPRGPWQKNAFQNCNMCSSIAFVILKQKFRKSGFENVCWSPCNILRCLKLVCWLCSDFPGPAIYTSFIF